MSAAAADAGRSAEPATPRPLQGRVVLVAGAHGGLGSAASLACARAGARVVLLGRSLPKLNRVYDALQQQLLSQQTSLLHAASQRGLSQHASTQHDAEPLLYPLDMEGASPDDYAEMAARIEAEVGRLDGLLHCAAEFRGLTPLSHTDPAAFACALHVGLTAKWWLTQACLPLLMRADDAAVVFALDDLERTGQAYWGGYGLAQHALAALVGMLHGELGNARVRVAGLQPGPMRTDLRARAYVAEDDTVARAPVLYAQACVELLSSAGAVHRGKIWTVAHP